MTPREQVLSTVRRSLGVTGAERPRKMIVEERMAAHAPGVVPARASAKSPEQRVALFVEMAEASAATVAIVSSVDEIPGAVAEFLRAHNLAPALRRGADPRLAKLPWEHTTLDVTTGRSFGDDAASLSAAAAAVAETGTLVLVSGEDNPTTLNFLPDNHIVVLDAADVAGTYEDVWATVRQRFGDGVLPRTVNWITGPSRSADIEQILLMGAHGPRRLHIVLVDPTAASAAAVPADPSAVPAGSTPLAAETGSTLAVDPKAPDSGPATPPSQEPAALAPDARAKPAPDRDEDDDVPDESLDGSFFASDPPSRTQP